MKAIGVKPPDNRQWKPNGRELFFRNGDAMMAAAISTQSGFAAGKPQVLFHGPYLATTSGYARANYDVSTDGQRFLMLKRIGQSRKPLTEIHQHSGLEASRWNGPKKVGGAARIEPVTGTVNKRYVAPRPGRAEDEQTERNENEHLKRAKYLRVAGSCR